VASLFSGDQRTEGAQAPTVSSWQYGRKSMTFRAPHLWAEVWRGVSYNGSTWQCMAVHGSKWQQARAVHCGPLVWAEAWRGAVYHGQNLRRTTPDAMLHHLCVHAGIVRAASLLLCFLGSTHASSLIPCCCIAGACPLGKRALPPCSCAYEGAPVAESWVICAQQPTQACAVWLACLQPCAPACAH